MSHLKANPEAVCHAFEVIGEDIRSLIKGVIEESKGASLVFCWDTHLTKIKGRNVLFIVNASNRYTIAMTDIEPRNWNYYTMYIRSVIHGVMQEMGYSEEQIGQYYKMSGDTTVTKTHGRKSVGGINRMVMDAQYFGHFSFCSSCEYGWCA